MTTRQTLILTSRQRKSTGFNTPLKSNGIQAGLIDTQETNTVSRRDNSDDATSRDLLRNVQRVESPASLQREGTIHSIRNNACTNYVSATHRFCSYIMTREQRCTERTLTRMGRSKVGSRLYRIFLRKPLRWSEFFGVQSKTRELRALIWALRSCARKSYNGLKRNNFSVRTAVASC